MIAQMSTETLMEAVSYGFRLAHAKTQQERNEIRLRFTEQLGVYAQTDLDFAVMHDFFDNLEKAHPLPVVQSSGGEEG